MKNIQIGAALKTMRKNRGWTIHDVVVQLNDLYNIAVAEKTVYGWESDQAYPRTETLLLLCELYQSDTFTGNLLHIPADKSSRSLQMNGMSSKCIAGIRNYKVL